jgi:hypothetical protein
VLVLTPVSVLVATTCAPATTAPLGSVMVPRTVPVIVCAMATPEIVAKTAIIKLKHLRNKRPIFACPPEKISDMKSRHSVLALGGFSYVEPTIR